MIALGNWGYVKRNPISKSQSNSVYSSLGQLQLLSGDFDKSVESSIELVPSSVELVESSVELV